MHKGPGPKRKSQKRFEQLNHIVDNVAPTLKSASHVAVLLVCYRHAWTGGTFQISNRRIADSAGTTHRHARRVMDDLEAAGVIELVAEHQGPIPRRYRITGRSANGVSHVPIKAEHTPQANGDMGSS